jgi:hypothetical protein
MYSQALTGARCDQPNAKANYTRTGKECPENEIEKLADCTKIAAQQCIRWFYLTDDAIKHHDD